jgi:hypothetical protein
MRVRLIVPLAVLFVSTAAHDAAALTLDREVRIDPRRVTVSTANGVATVERGAPPATTRPAGPTCRGSPSAWTCPRA